MLRQLSAIFPPSYWGASLFTSAVREAAVWLWANDNYAAEVDALMLVGMTTAQPCQESSVRPSATGALVVCRFDFGWRPPVLIAEDGAMLPLLLQVLARLLT